MQSTESHPVDGITQDRTGGDTTAWPDPGPGGGLVVEDTRWRPELAVIVRLAAPTIVQGAAQQAMLVTDQLFVGHLGTNALAAAALGNTFQNIMWFFLLGSSTALDTLGAQAFGARNHAALVMVTFTSAVVLSAMCLVLMVALAFGRFAATGLFGQSAEVAGLVGDYCWGLMPGMLPMVLGLTLMKYLQTQNLMMVPAVITVAAFIINIGANYALIAWLGFQGTSLATSFSRFCLFVFLAIAVARRERGLRAASPSALDVPSAAGPSSSQGLEGATASDAGNAKGSSNRLTDGSAEEAGSSKGERLTDAGGASPPRLAAPAAASGATAAPDSGGQDDAESLLEMQPLRGNKCDSDSAAETSVGHGGGGGEGARVSLHGHRLAKQPSWFRLNSWRGGLSFKEAPGTAGAEAAETEAERGVGPSEAAGGGSGAAAWRERNLRTGRYLLSQARASVHPQLLKRFLKLALPGGFMLAFEASAFDVTTAMAGHLGVTATGAHAALLGIIYLTYSAMPFAIATAANIRVGNLLGSGQPMLARKSGFLSVGLSVAFMSVAATVIFATRNVLGRAFSSDEEVVSTMAMLAPFAAIMQVSDGVLGSTQGVLRGCGRQLTLMVTNVLGFWVMGVLLGYLLTFHAGLGLRGLWIGIVSGDTTAASFNVGQLLLVRWADEAAKARDRVRDMQPLEDESSQQRDASAAEGGPLLAGDRSGDVSRRRKADALAASRLEMGS